MAKQPPKPIPPTWRGIRETVMTRIRSGDWQPGALLPTEEELAREFKCARMTVGRALRELAGEGLLDRRRRAGTRVAETPVRRATLTIPILRHEVEATGATYRHAVIDAAERRPPPAIAARMGVPTDRVMVQLQTLHLADGRPYAAEDRWINTDAVPGIREVDLDAISANEWLVRHAYFTRGDISFGAEPATAELAGQLQVEPGVALFTMDRTTWREADPVTAVRLSYPPGHRLSMTL